jgi:hypothetical protein
MLRTSFFISSMEAPLGSACRAHGNVQPAIGIVAAIRTAAMAHLNSTGWSDRRIGS